MSAFSFSISSEQIFFFRSSTYASFASLFLLYLTRMARCNSEYFSTSERILLNSSSEILLSPRAFDIRSFMLFTLDSQIASVFSCLITFFETFFALEPVITLAIPQINPTPPIEAPIAIPTPVSDALMAELLRIKRSVPIDKLILERML